MMNINRMMPFCNLFMERPSYFAVVRHLLQSIKHIFQSARSVSGMLMRPAKCEAEARYNKAEVEAKAKKLRGSLTGSLLFANKLIDWLRPTPNSVRPRLEMPY